MQEHGERVPCRPHGYCDVTRCGVVDVTPLLPSWPAATPAEAPERTCGMAARSGSALARSSGRNARITRTGPKASVA